MFLLFPNLFQILHTVIPTQFYILSSFKKKLQKNENKKNPIRQKKKTTKPQNKAEWKPHSVNLVLSSSPWTWGLPGSVVGVPMASIGSAGVLNRLSVLLVFIPAPSFNPPDSYIWSCDHVQEPLKAEVMLIYDVWMQCFFTFHH